MGTLLMCCLGLLVGLLMGATVRHAGLFVFEHAAFSVALSVACHGYVVNFKRCSSSADIPGYCVLLITSFAVACLVVIIGRISMQMQLAVLHHYGFFGGLGVASVLCWQVCVSIFLHEDERKHFLGLCGPGGEALDLARCTHSGSANAECKWESFVIFARWIITWQWWHDCTFIPADKPHASAMPPHGGAIKIYNQSLKQIKVCVYSSADMLCWLPYGGIAGRHVGFIHAEESYTFLLPHEPPGHPSNCYTLKVFQPCIFDLELACYRGACGSQCLAFVDIEGMVQLARPHMMSVLQLQHKSCNALPESSEDALPESSKDEDTPVSMDGDESINPAPKGSCPWSPASNGSSLTRCSSAGSLLPEGSHELQPLCRLPASPTRPTRMDEIVVHNRSTQEIRALLFRLNDYSCIVPLVGKLIFCGDVILPETERRFVPKDGAEEFTLKLYSVGPSARELTYFTVTRGREYTFCGSLVA